MLTAGVLGLTAACDEIEPTSECPPSTVEHVHIDVDNFYQSLHDSLGENLVFGQGSLAEKVSLAAVTDLRAGTTAKRTVYTQYAGNLAERTTGFTDQVTVDLTPISGTDVWEKDLPCGTDPSQLYQRQVNYQDVELHVAHSPIRVGEHTIPAVPLHAVMAGSSVEQMVLYILPTTPNTPISGTPTPAAPNISHTDIVAIIGGILPSELPPYATETR